MIKGLLIIIVIYLFLIYAPANKKFDVFKGVRYCHRGYHNGKDLPENSLGAFKKAVNNGFGFEFDVHLLKDGNLAVIHDSDIERMTGKKLIIEELTTKDLKECHLLDTEYTIPTFKEVLEVVKGKVPIIIEIKFHCSSAKAICEEVMKQLEGYEGLYCVECFYTEVLAYMRKNYPKVLRGQLTFDYFKNNNHIWPISFALQYLLLNFWGRPDFIAYEVSARNNLSNRILRDILKVRQVNWTIKSMEDLIKVEKEGAIAIFENLDL